MCVREREERRGQRHARDRERRVTNDMRDGKRGEAINMRERERVRKDRTLTQVQEIDFERPLTQEREIYYQLSTHKREIN